MIEDKEGTIANKIIKFYDITSYERSNMWGMRKSVSDIAIIKKNIISTNRCFYFEKNDT